jgi:hypothetical protein
MINISTRILHSFKNNTNNIARVLVIVAPGDMEKLFEVRTAKRDSRKMKKRS